MKRIIAFFLFVVCFFGLTLEISNADPDKEWNFRSYVEYVTENIEPFPSIDLTLEFDEDSTGIERIVCFFEWTFDLIAYPLRVVSVVFKNFTVILDGFFPINWDFVGGAIPGQSGGNGDYGDFGGGGFGGGGGGAR